MYARMERRETEDIKQIGPKMSTRPKTTIGLGPLDRGAHEYTGSSGYSQKQGHRDWLLVKGNRKRKAPPVCRGMGPSEEV